MLKKISDEVFYLQENVRVVTEPMLEFIKQQALRNPRQRCRLCLHSTPEDALHEMIIVHTKDVFVPPHVHSAKAESFSIISGKATLYLLNSSGQPTEAIPLGEPGSGRALCAKIPAGQWHTQRFESDVAVFYEVTSGPFTPQGTATLWDANSPDHEAMAAAFLKKLNAFM